MADVHHMRCSADFERSGRLAKALSDALTHGFDPGPRREHVRVLVQSLTDMQTALHRYRKTFLGLSANGDPAITAVLQLIEQADVCASTGIRMANQQFFEA